MSVKMYMPKLRMLGKIKKLAMYTKIVKNKEGKLWMKTEKSNLLELISLLLYNKLEIKEHYQFGLHFFFSM